MMGKKRNAVTKNDINIISRWGDCVVSKLTDGTIIEVLRCDGKKICTGTVNKGTDLQPLDTEFKQTEFFGSNNYRGVKQYVDVDLFMPPCNRENGQKSS